MEKLLLELLQSEYTLTEKEIGEFRRIDKNGMHFQVKAYEIEGVGQCCIMDMKAMLGLMKMQTVVITPLLKQVPLISYDRILAFGNETVITEFYDTLTGPWDGVEFSRIKQSYAIIPDRDPGEHWYDSLRLRESLSKKAKHMTEEFTGLKKACAEAILQNLKASAPCAEEEKRAKTAVYVEGLIKNGGPAVDQFKKMLGEEKTAYFLRKIMFGSESL